MPEQDNRRVVLASRPEGAPTPDNFRLESLPAPCAGPGQAVVRNLWLSVDPYMRGRMSEGPSYAAPVELDDVMVGGTVSQVVSSNSPWLSVGQIVLTHGGWQDYALLDARSIRAAHLLDRKRLPLSTALGVAGMPGATAYLGLTKLGKPKEGETLVVSAAAGAVGSVVGQLAKQAGCRVVGIAGGEVKRRLCEDSFGFDICIDYKATTDLSAALKEACPEGIDIYFENVGGTVLDAVLPLLKDGSRVPICGFVSQYNEQSPRAPWDVLHTAKAKVDGRFFLVTEWMGEMPHVYEKLATMVEDGTLVYRETVTRGLEQAPQAFVDMLAGKNVGKQVVRIASPA